MGAVLAKKRGARNTVWRKWKGMWVVFPDSLESESVSLPERRHIGGSALSRAVVRPWSEKGGVFMTGQASLVTLRCEKA